MSQLTDIYDPKSEGKDYILQVKIKNGPLLRAMRMRGFLNAHQFCLKTRMQHNTVGEYLSLKKTPISRSGEWKPSALALAKHLQLPPESLFPEQHLQHALAKANGEIEISHDEVLALVERSDPEYAGYREELCSVVNMIMGCLRPREERILRLRNGFYGESKTYEDIAHDFGISSTRVRQIEIRAYGRLKNYKNMKELADVGYIAAENVLSQKRCKE